MNSMILKMLLLVLAMMVLIAAAVLLLAGIIWLVTRLTGKARGPAAATVPPMHPSPGSPPTQAVPRQCPKCGTQLKSDAPEGLCPACLLQHGIATEGGAPPGTPAFTPPPLPELAKLFPQLEILEMIGQGGMGAVYKARQPALERFVALKILAPKSGGDVDFEGRFTREARALAKLSHPNIVGVHDFGTVSVPSTPDPRPLNYFLMEYVDGPNLREVERAGKLTPREALQIIPQICAALQFAHDEGIVHRDIKPENVLLDKKGRVKIADFGLAKILGQPTDFRLTGARDVMGTPHYMAPEQVEKPQEVDHRADIYSLGVVFYEMLTGELPLGKFDPPSHKVQIDVRLDDVVLRTLAKSPERRYQQVSEVKTEVESITATPGTASAPPPVNRPIVFPQGWEYKSARTLFGLPLLHVSGGINPETGKANVSRGIIAVGQVARGVIAMGGRAYGGIAFGGVAMGFFAFGGIAVGGIAFGGIALALLLGFGGFSTGLATVGEPSLGWHHEPVRVELMVPLFVVPFVVFIVSHLLLTFWARQRAVAFGAAGRYALEAVQAWIGLTDKGEYPRSWDTAAPYFQRAVARDEWVRKLNQVRFPLGKVLSRKLESSRFTAAGTRFVAKFATSFEGALATVETVTFGRQPNGEWQAIGYYIKPEGVPPLPRFQSVAFTVASVLLAVLLLFIGWTANQMGMFFNALFVFILLMVPVRVLLILWHTFHGTVEHRLWRKPLAPELGKYRWRVINRWIFWVLAAVVLEICIVPAQFTAEQLTAVHVLTLGGVAVLMLLELLPPRRMYLATSLVYTIGSIFMAVQIAHIYWPESKAKAVVLSMPVRGDWLMLNAGRSALINTHYSLREQRNAIDMEKLADGHERTGAPRKLESYPSWGEVVYSPVDGTVVAAKDDLDDNAVGETDRDNPVGNGISIDMGGGHFVLMAHFQKGSLLVSTGQVVQVGQPLAKCGNSGNTSHPHLHIQVQDQPRIFVSGGPEATTDPILFRDATRVRGRETISGAPFFVRRNDQVIAGAEPIENAAPNKLASPDEALIPPFGPVEERVIQTSGTEHRALNLASGNFMQPSRGRDFIFTSGGEDTLRVAGVELYISDEAVGPDNIQSLDMRLLVQLTPYSDKAAKELTLDAISAKDFEGLLEQMRHFQSVLDGGDVLNGSPLGFDLKKVEPTLRGTNLYAFITRDGTKGLLQIAGVTENPRGVKVRYKLMRKLPETPREETFDGTFRQYPLNHTWLELAQMPTAKTPEGAAARFHMAVLDDDPATAMSRYVMDFMRFPPGTMKFTVDEQGRETIKQCRVSEVIIYRDELAAMIMPNYGGPGFVTVISGRRNGQWKICLTLDIPNTGTIAEAEENFRERAVDLDEAFQKMPDVPPSIAEESVKQLTAGMTNMMGAVMGVTTQVMSQLPGVVLNLQQSASNLDQQLQQGKQ
jgi:predicted Ser/Thr protein kinase